MRSIRLFIINNFTEKSLFLLLLLGIGILLVWFFAPKGKKVYMIDWKRMLESSSQEMSKFNRYVYSLSVFSVLRVLIPKDTSEKYKKCEDKIKEAGGLDGCCPEVIYTEKWLLFIVACITAIIMLFIFPIQGMTYMLLLFSIPCIMFYIPDIWLKYKAEERKENLLEELQTIELFTSIYLSSGYGIYDLLIALEEVTVYTKEYIQECIKEFYTGQEEALQHFANKVDIEEYQLLIDILKQSIKLSSEKAVGFVNDHMKQMEKIKELALKEKDKKSPVKYVLILFLPFVSVIVLWLYPLVLKAINTFSCLSKGF